MKNNDIFTKTLVVAATLLTTSMLSISYAEIPGITTGAQLQAEAEQRTKIITTEELKKELDENLDMILVDIRLPSEITSMGAIKAIKIETFREAG